MKALAKISYVQGMNEKIDSKKAVNEQIVLDWSCQLTMTSTMLQLSAAKK